MNLLLLLRQKLKLTRPRVPRITQAGFIRFTQKSLATYLIVFIAFSGTAGFFLFNPFGTKKTEAAWFSDNWAYRKTITINESMISGSSSLTNFPLLVSLSSDSGLAANAQDDGDDIVFTSFNGEVLSHEIEKFDGSTGELVAWLRIPSLASTTNTVIYIYYGNPSASNQQRPTAVWESQYQIVQHMEETSTSSTINTDSTMYVNNAIKETANRPTPATGQIAGSQDKSISALANDWYIQNPAPPSGTQDYTISFWVDPNNAGNYNAIYWGNNGSDVATFAILLVQTTGRARLAYNQSTVLNATTDMNGAGYYHVVLTRSGNTHTFYIDGAAAGSVSSSTSLTFSGTCPMHLVNSWSGTDCVNNANTTNTMAIDEFKYALGVAKSADWIATEYNNQESPATYLTVGSEEKGPSPTLYWEFDQAQGSTAEDATSNALDGTLNNTPAWQSPDMCVSNSCLYFDGSNNENVSLADNDKIDFTASTNFTLSAWIRKNGAASANSVILQKSTANLGSTYTGYKLYMDDSGDLCFGIQDGTNSADSACTSGVDFDDNQWHFISGVKSGTSSITLFIDGLQRAQDSSIASTGSLANSSTFRVGIDSDGTSNDWLGSVDEVKIIQDNTARTSTQITADYNARSSLEGVSQQMGNNIQNMPQALSNGLVGYWKMDEVAGSANAVDSSGNGNTGTYTSGATTTQGKFGNGGSFDGTNDRIDIADNSLLEPSEDMTLSAWVKFDTVPGAGVSDKFVYKDEASSPYVGYELSYSGDGYFYFARENNASVYEFAFYSLTPSTNTWYHVTGVKKGDKIYCFVNAVTNQNPGSSSGTLYNTSGSLRLGIGYNGTSDPFDGVIDEVRLYNRSLSDTEISQLYNWAPEPVGYWRLDERTGSTAADASGYANNGTLGSTTAAPTWANGKYGSALSYDGGDTVSVSDSTSLSLTGGFSLAAWVNVPNVSGYKPAVTKENAGQTGYFLYVLDDEVYTGYGNGAWRSQTTSTSPITANTWIHIASTFDGTTLTTYVNGASVQSSTPGGSVSDNASALGIGNAADLSSMYTGLIDEAKVYNYPRTAGQIVADMNAGHPAPGSPVGTPAGNWKFDEGFSTTLNNSGNGGSTYNGASSNMASPPTSDSGWTNSGKLSRGLVFDGSDDVVTVTNGTGIDLNDNLANFTFSSWIYPDSDGEADTGQIFNKGTNTYLRVDSQGSTDLDLECNLDRTTDTNVNVTDALTTGTWSHVACSWNGTTLSVYVDGRLRGSSSSGSGAIAADANNLLIGGSTSNNFDGRIDEFKVYNSALTQSEVSLDANIASSQILGALGNNSTAGAPQSASQEYCVPGSSATCTGPNMRLTFEEGSGTTANDITGNANSGSLSGSPGWGLGKFGKGLAFDASDDIVTVSGLANDFFTGSWTQELWIKTTQTGNKVLTEKGSNNAFIQTNSGQIRAGTVGADVYDTTGTPLVTDGAWHHVAVTYDTSTNLTTTYIDGVVRGTKTAASDAGSSATAFALGSRVGLSAMYQGQMDDVRVYNYTRSAAQIAWEYNRGLPLAQYNLDECQGTTLNNSISSSFTGTLTVGGSGSSTTVGTCTTSGAWYNGVTGKRNYSISLDGTDDYVTLANTSSFPANNASQTIAAWLYYPTTPVTTATAVSLVNTGSTSITAIQVRSGNIGVFKWSGTTLASTTQPAQATWNHVVYTYDGTTHSLYLNGRLANTSTTSPNSATPNAAYLGDYTASGGEYWPGQIDDVRIYNYPLTAAQALLLFNDGAARYGPVTGAP